MLNPDWTYNYLQGAQSAANLQLVIPDDDKDTILSVASFDSREDSEEILLDTKSVYTSVLKCFATNLCDGFLIGAGTASAFSIFPHLVRGRFVKAAKSPFNKGNLKIAIFFSLLLGSYNAGRFFVRTRNRGNKRRLSSRALRALVAIIIGYSGSLLSNRVRRFIALFLLSRGFETKVKDIYRHLSSPTQKKIEPYVEYADVALATVSMSINGAAWIMNPELLDKSYLRFLDSFCGYPTDALRGTSKLFNPAYKFERQCEPLHPHAPHGCLVEVSKFAVNQYFRDSIRFYYKLFLIPLLITTVKKRKLSVTALKYFVQRTFQSAFFLTFGGVAMTLTFCTFDKLGLHGYRVMPFIAGSMSGGLVIVETKSRRLELGLYLFTQAMHVIAAFYASRGWWYPPGADLLAIAAGFYQVISAYEDSLKQRSSDADAHGTLLRPFYIGTMKKIFDFEEIIEEPDSCRRVDKLHAWSVMKYVLHHNRYD
jgi:hypothetical protein